MTYGETDKPDPTDQDSARVILGLHAVHFIRDTVKFLISMSHIFAPNFDINCPIVCPIDFPCLTWVWAYQ